MCRDVMNTFFLPPMCARVSTEKERRKSEKNKKQQLESEDEERKKASELYV
jgi:hypothetical protein